MKSIDNLLNNRTLSMGIAIAMVVMYHLFCVDKIKPLSVFYPGFLGVDIFLFVSGYGLCYSFKKNSLKTFYTRRYKRILPIYVVTALILTIAVISKGHNMSIFDVVCNITSLSYYGIGGVFIDWYLSTLMVLYLAFPILLKLVNRGGGKIGGIVISTLIFIIIIGLAYADLDWQYECFLARIPIFCSGILYYKNKSVFSRLVVPAYCLGLVLTLALYKFHYVHTYLIFYMLAPIVLVTVGYVVGFINKPKTRKTIEIFGKRSLEIYASNQIAMSLVSFFEIGQYVIALYFALNVIFAFMFCLFNDIVQNRILCEKK